MIGNAGSGKTTFARALSRQLGVPHVELDAVFWQPGWVETPPDEFKQRVHAALLDAYPHVRLRSSRDVERFLRGAV